MLCREQLATVIADMAIMRERWQTDVRQVEELALIAGQLLAMLHRGKLLISHSQCDRITTNFAWCRVYT